MSEIHAIIQALFERLAEGVQGKRHRRDKKIDAAKAEAKVILSQLRAERGARTRRGNSE